MAEASIPALRAPAPQRDNPLTRSLAGMIGMAFLGLIVVACLGSLPYTLQVVRAPGAPEGTGSARYELQHPTARHLPPWWLGTKEEAGPDSAERRLEATARLLAIERIARSRTPEASVEQLIAEGVEPTPAQVAAARPRYWLGTDLLGRSLLIRVLTGGGISLTIGIAAAGLSVFVGTIYGALAGYLGGRTDAVMMRIVDILYGLPYILLVVLLAVASDAAIDEYIGRNGTRAAWVVTQVVEEAAKAGERISREEADARLRQDEALRARLEEAAIIRFPARELSGRTRLAMDLATLFVAIGGVSWLTMARVVRGQVLSLKAQPFMEAARAMGVPVVGQFTRHLLPNLVGPITVYATLTVPQAILQESFLSFLGIGVRPPLPSWGNLAAEGLVELNPYRSRWWLLLFPCLLLGLTLLALNFVGEGLREALDPKRGRAGRVK